MTALTFEDNDLAERLEFMTDDERHNLRFGCVRLDDEEKVRFFSHTEARLSGFGERRTLGRNVFTSIAPCMNNAELRERIEHSRASGKLDVEIGHTGDFEDPARF